MGAIYLQIVCVLQQRTPESWGGAELTPWQQWEAQQMESIEVPRTGHCFFQAPACGDTSDPTKHSTSWIWTNMILTPNKRKQKEEKNLGWANADQNSLKLPTKCCPTQICTAALILPEGLCYMLSRFKLQSHLVKGSFMLPRSIRNLYIKQKSKPQIFIRLVGVTVPNNTDFVSFQQALRSGTFNDFKAPLYLLEHWVRLSWSLYYSI